MKLRTKLSLVVSALSFFASSVALADDPPPVTVPATPTPTTAPAATTTPAASGEASASGSTTGWTRTAAASTAPTAAPEAAGDSDHDRMVGHLAVGYFGVTNVPIAAGAGAGGITAGNVSAPVVGVRYWIKPQIGVDVGLGLGWTGGSRESVNGATTVTTKDASVFGAVLHGGVPIALVSAKHYVFQVVPELNIGYATSTVSAQNVPAGQPTPPDISLSGFRFDVGARAGAEVHFGFIGVPQLALQGSIGLNFGTESRSFKQDTVSASTSRTGFGTSVQASPWAIFTNNISALYYF